MVLTSLMMLEVLSVVVVVRRWTIAIVVLVGSDDTARSHHAAMTQINRA